MLKNLFVSFSLAIENIRSHLFHTILSILGIVIGVTALVAILSLIDGMQQYAFKQINRYHSLKSVIVRSERYKMIDNVWVKQDSVPYLTYAEFTKLKSSLTLPSVSYFSIHLSDEIKAKEKDLKTGAFIVGAAASFPEYVKIAYGGLFTEKDVNQANPVVIINHYLANKLAKNASLKDLLGRTIIYQDKELKITGILQQDSNNEQASRITIPITLLSDKSLDENPPQCIIQADKVDNVVALKSQVEAWMKKAYPTNFAAFSIATDDDKLQQIARDFILFKVIMGMIVGISILVGGIGVMNVLLISVNERTSEIGLRKAVGAKRKDIMLLFLSESITISAFGSGLGLLLGILSTLAIVPIIKAFVPVPFEASYTLTTLIIIAIIAILVGIVFGTYPAIRASKLDPVEAIRRE